MVSTIDGTSLGDLVPFQMNYDAEAQVLSTKMALLANTSTSDVAAIDKYDDVTLTPTDPFAPIESLRASNFRVDVTNLDAPTTVTDLSDYDGQTGRVAIRHFNTTDQFAIVVDDITYTFGGQPESYNVYYEGRLVANVSEENCQVTADQLTDGEHLFAVSAVYGNGQESKPVTVVINVLKTGIDSLAFDGQPVDVYTLDGKLVKRQTLSLRGLKGFYVVNGKTVLIK